MKNPFKKKKKEEAVIPATSLLSLFQQQAEECPSSQLATKRCVCISCPQKGTCVLEITSRSNGCEASFVRACSLRAKLVSGSLDRVVFDNFLTQFASRILDEHGKNGCNGGCGNG